MFTVTTYSPAGAPTGARDDRLERWGQNVGPPVARDYAVSRTSRPWRRSDLVVLSWNVWIGRGRLAEVVGKLRAGDYEDLGAPRDAPLVALVQEAYRSDDTVPPVSNGGAPRDRPGDFRPDEDIVDVARALSLNLRYVPSMRNASHRSDRGNAVLTDLPIEDAGGSELPFVVQRRVALGVTLALQRARGPHLRLRACSAHLDPWGALGRDWLGVNGRAMQAGRLLETLDAHPDAGLATVLGADLNTTRGLNEAAYLRLLERGFTAGVPHRAPAWRHTYHLVPRRPIDHILFRAANDGVRAATVHRLNENPRDKGAFVFGSDHHPLLASVELTASRSEER